MRPTAPTMVVAAAAALMAACTSTQPGQPSPSADHSASSTGPGGASPVANSLSGINACTLLTDDEARQVAPGVASHVDEGTLGGDGTSHCQWKSPSTDESSGFVFGITVRPAQGIQDVSSDPPNPEVAATRAMTNGGRQAVVMRNNQGEGSCSVSIAVGSGRVDIDGQLARSTTEESCSKVSKLSDVVEPKLPAS